jgi:hypothetical protein
LPQRFRALQPAPSDVECAPAELGGSAEIGRSQGAFRTRSSSFTAALPNGAIASLRSDVWTSSFIARQTLQAAIDGWMRRPEKLVRIADHVSVLLIGIKE